ncbi:tetraacyldisaccharide 4'-kinase [Robiginitalea sp. IMCC44478]|uniref:tetraacyldisaccharide 4'-kinase n=1 Tax=Robiginitalea sp. IMCC44478 TaxID=3459122 RepID=UPI004042E194
MNFIRKLALPVSLIYGLVVYLRNKCYDWGWFTSISFSTPVLCVGNLSVGGTGKTPMVEWLLREFDGKKKVAVLSRGYGRKTKGFLMAAKDKTAADLGDEPAQLYLKFPRVTIAVDGNRRRGIRKLQEMVAPDLIILDDGFQHRRVQPRGSILLTTYDSLYTEDFYLPSGSLRDHKSQASRADVVVVTKSPEQLSDASRERIRNRLKLHSEQLLLFASLAYEQARTPGGKTIELDTLRDTALTVVTGIARPEPLLNYLRSVGLQFRHLRFADHHHFSPGEIKQLQKEKCVITTEKDAVRLRGQLDAMITIGVKHHFAPEDEILFKGFLSGL